MEKGIKELEQAESCLADSKVLVQKVSSEWDSLEALLIGDLFDKQSLDTPNRIFDPILSTIVFERVARVMAQSPRGKAYAQSKDDLGKNQLMNLLLNYFYKNANEQFPMLIKLRLWDLYSLVYGAMFALVPWRVAPNSYIGGELNILPIRNCFPQTSKPNVADMDWFIVKSRPSISWLKAQNPKYWDAEQIAQLEREVGEGDAEDSEDRSYLEERDFPSRVGDKRNPVVNVYTQYCRDGTWVTWAPAHTNSKTSRPRLLRLTRNSYPEGYLPIVAKYAFPLLDNPFGFGEFARGKGLQYGINSLWNLYLEGVKYSIFPPLHVNPKNTVMSTIRWKQGEYWYMQNPNQDVQPMYIKPSLDTFNVTLGAFKSAIESQAGTTSVRESSTVKSALGKSPEAIRYLSEKEGARDEWDRVMMEQAITDVYDRWIRLAVTNMEKSQYIRIFGDEISAIQKVFPDATELFGDGGRIKVNKKMIDATYDFVLEAGSTSKPNLESEQENATLVLKAVLENPAILQSLQGVGKTIDIPELFKRWLEASGIRDVERIVVSAPKPEEQPGVQPEVQSKVSELLGGLPAYER